MIATEKVPAVREAAPGGEPAGKEVLHVRLWGLMALCVLGGIAQGRLHSSLLTALFALGFWASLLVYLQSAMDLRRNVRLFLPLFPLYLLFLTGWKLLVTEVARDPSFFGTDGFRFLFLANQWQIEARHLGWSLFIFQDNPASAVEGLVGVSHLGRWLLHLQMAAFGVLAATMVFVLLRQATTRVVSLLVAYFFALSLAVWGLASVVDTYIVSVFLLLAFLAEARLYFDGRRKTPVVPALITAILLSISLEHVYVPLLMVAVHVFLERPRLEQWRGLLGFAAVTAVAFGCFLVAAVAALKEPVGESAGNFGSFLQRFSVLEELFSWEAFSRVTFNESISMILAQPELPIGRASALPPGGPGWTSVVYVILMVTLLWTLLRAARAGEQRLHSPFAWLLVGLVVWRHLFMTVFSPNERVLFSPPTIAVIALGLGYGAVLLRDDRAKHLRYAWTLLALDLLLLFGNGAYLLRELRANW